MILSCDTNEYAAFRKAVPSIAPAQGARIRSRDCHPMEKRVVAVQNGDQRQSNLAERPDHKPVAPLEAKENETLWADKAFRDGAMANLLLIEDDTETANEIKAELGDRGYAVDWAADGIEGLDKARSGEAEVVIVDRLLPGMDGLTIVEALRTEGMRTPVLVLSALGAVDDRVRGLRAGGDDYLTKPFATVELVARIEALLRRPTESRDTLLRVGPLVLDLMERTAKRGDRTIDLLPREFRLLEYMMRRKDQVLTRAMLLEEVWKDVVVNPDSVYQTVTTLRRSLKDDARDPKYIVNVVRRGYRLIAPVSPWEEKSATAPGTIATIPLVATDSEQTVAASNADGTAAPPRVTGTVNPSIPPPASDPAVEVDPAREPEPEAQPRPESALWARPSDVQPVRTMEDTPRQVAVAPRTGHRRYIVPLTALALVLVGAAVVRVWISKEPSRESAAMVTPSFAPPPNSIAVLPFINLSGDKDQEYFSDGLSEELIDMLTKVPELRVPARTSSFYFKGKRETIVDIAKALGVAHVLEGSVRKSGNTLRITAQLVRVDNGYHVWSETYDRKPDDIFKIQDEIAGAVVTALKAHLLPMQQPSDQEELRTGNLAAYNLYLQGRQSYNQGDAAGYQRAVTAFRAATTLDSRYAAAYTDLALAQFWLTADTPEDVATDTAGFDSALAAANKAVALAPGLAAGYSARGFLRAVFQFDFAGAQADLDKAVALNPGDANVLHRSAVLLAVLGKLPEAIAREEQALALDPLSGEICMRLGFFLAANRQFAQARPLYEKALAIAPNSTLARYHLAELELLEHQPERALAIFRQTGDEDFNLTGQAKAQFSLGHVDVSRQVLEQLIAKKSSPHLIAEVYAWRGEKDQAFEWAERAYEQRDAGLTWLKIDTDFRGLRGDPRYKALLRKMNLPE
jgi:DNA-binding response OmpR family regulator/TolB-like protein/predicted Zn-dependent protease